MTLFPQPPSFPQTLAWLALQLSFDEIMPAFPSRHPPCNISLCRFLFCWKVGMYLCPRTTPFREPCSPELLQPLLVQGCPHVCWLADVWCALCRCEHSELFLKEIKKGVVGQMSARGHNGKSHTLSDGCLMDALLRASCPWSPWWPSAVRSGGDSCTHLHGSRYVWGDSLIQVHSVRKWLRCDQPLWDPWVLACN